MQEFPGSPGNAPPPAIEPSSAEQAEAAALMPRFQAASGWFFTIAILSLVNSGIAFFGGGWRFIFGLGLTTVADAFIVQGGSLGKGVGAVFSLAMAGLFAIFGFLSRKHFHWVYLVGMVFYLLDGLVSLLIQDWLGGAFHAYALWQLYQGVAPSKRLSEIHRASQGGWGSPTPQ